MAESDLLHGYLILVYIFLGMFGVLFLIFLCKRWKSLSRKTFLRDLGREFGYRDSAFRESTSSQTTLWRATSTWNSKSYNYVRHSTSSLTNGRSSSGGGGVPSIVVTENRTQGWSKSPSVPYPYPTSALSPQPTNSSSSSSWEVQRSKRSSSGFVQIPLDVIEEEETVTSLGGSLDLDRPNHEQHHDDNNGGRNNANASGNNGLAQLQFPPDLVTSHPQKSQ